MTIGPNEQVHLSLHSCTRAHFAVSQSDNSRSRIDERRCDDLLHELSERHGEHHPAVSLLHGVLATEERERSSIWSTTAGLFAGVRTEAARASAREAPLDVERVPRGAAPAPRRRPEPPPGSFDPPRRRTHRRARPRHLRPPRRGRPPPARTRRTRERRSPPSPGEHRVRRWRPGRAHARLPAGSLSQARARWGTTAEGFLSLFPTTLVLAGHRRPPHARDAAPPRRARARHRRPTSSATRKGRAAGHSTSWIERDRIRLSELAQGRDGYALGLDAQNHLKWVELTPAYKDPRFRPYLERPLARATRSTRSLAPLSN